MKHDFTALLLSGALSMVSVNTLAQGSTGNVNFFLGQKALEEDDWAPLDEQAELGALFDFRQPDWPVNLAVDLLVSADSMTEAFTGIELTASTVELDAGIRKHFESSGPVTPYIGGGIAFIQAEIEASYGSVSVTEDDSGVGYWMNAGIAWTIGQVNLGLDLRYSDANATLSGYEVETGGTHVGVFAGYHW
jgi:opacity protein-like surface antigen